MKRYVIVVLGVLLALPSAAAAHGPPAISGGPSGTVDATSAEFSFNYDEPAPLQTFECQLDAGAWEACGDMADFGLMGGEGSASYSNLADGVHIFRVRRVSPIPSDPFSDTTPAERSWTIDTTPDEPPIT